MFKLIGVQAEGDCILESILTNRHEQNTVGGTYALTSAHDSMVKRLEELAEANEYSGLNRVVLSARSGKSHQVQLHSFDVVNSEAAVLVWCRDHQEKLNDDCMEFAIELKPNGLSVCATYVDGKLTSVVTRGYGHCGIDVTQNCGYVNGLPSEISGVGGETVELRGEIIVVDSKYLKSDGTIRKNYYDRYGDIREFIWAALEPDFFAPKARGLGFLCYDINYATFNTDFITQTDVAAFITSLGFQSACATKIYYGPEEVFDALKYFVAGHRRYQYEINGIVIKANSIAQQKTIGSNDGSPNWAIMFKKVDDIPLAQVTMLKWHYGSHGMIYPIARLTHHSCVPKTKSIVSLRNYGEVQRLNIREGDFVTLTRTGGTMLRVKGHAYLHGSDGDVKLDRLTHCPRCNSEVVTLDKGLTIWCGRRHDCKSIQWSRLTRFVSNEAMAIEGLTPGVLASMVRDEILVSPMDIYNLRDFKIKSLTSRGYPKDTIETILVSLEMNRVVSLGRFLYALDIAGVGPVIAGRIMKRFGKLDYVIKASIEDLKDVSGVGESTAVAVKRYFDNKANLSMVRNILRNSVVIEEPPTVNGYRLKDEQWVIHGSFKSMTRAEAKTVLTSLGAVVIPHVTTDTAAVLVGDDYIEQYGKAFLLGIKVYTEKDFLRYLDKVGIVFDEEVPY